MIKKALKKTKNVIDPVGRINPVLSSLQSEIHVSKTYLDERIEDMMILASQNLIRENNKIEKITNLSEVEFKVFSQWGQDGIIQYLIDKLEIPNKIFVEFGVQDYKESTTRFLLMNNNWSGLLIDGSVDNINNIKNQSIYWKYDLNAVYSFITKDNINSTLSENIDVEDIGLLVIDIDGNDYWIWEAISVIKPRIVFCEFNSLYGPSAEITVPYKDDFYRTNEHYSNLYFGASLAALCRLGDEKGYDFVGCNSAGNDAVFIRKEANKGLFKSKTAEEGYVASKFRESRDENGSLTYLSGMERLNLIKDMEVVNLKDNTQQKIKDIIKL